MATWQRVNDQQIAFTGALNRDTVPAVWADREQWLHGSDDIELELSGLDKVDTAGVAMLLWVERLLHEHQRKASWKNAPAQLKAIIEVSGVTDLLSFVDDK